MTFKLNVAKYISLKATYVVVIFFHYVVTTMWKNLTKILPLAFHESSMLPCRISLKYNTNIDIKVIFYFKVRRILHR